MSEQSTPKTPRRKWSKKKKRNAVIAVVLAAAVAAGGYYWFNIRNAASAESATTQRTATVGTGSIRVSVTGSGALEPVDKMTVTSYVTANIEEILHENGDTVVKGETLYVLDDTDAQAAATKIQNSIDDKTRARADVAESIADLSVTAPFQGIVTGITANIGDTVNSGTTVATVSDTSTLLLTSAFGASDMDGIRKGMTATVTLPDLMTTVTGTVTRIGNTSYVSSAGGTVVDVDIVIDNPGALKSGMSAEASINIGGVAVSALTNETLEYENVRTVKATSGGTVTSISAHNNDAVKSGAVLLTLENSDLTDSLRTYDTDLADLAVDLQDAKDAIADCVIIAPMDGVITGVDETVGDAAQEEAALCYVMQPSKFQFDVNIDELDITEITEGLEVECIFDAIPETETTPIIGTVSTIAVEGTASSGITYYPVTIVCEEDDRLRSGMNADGEIIISNVENVVEVPVEALQEVGTKYYVVVQGDVEGGTKISASASTGTAAAGGPGGTPPSGAPNGAPPSDASASGTDASASGTTASSGRGSGTGRGTSGSSSGTSSGTDSSSASGTAAASSSETSTAAAQRDLSKILNNSYYAGGTLVEVTTGVNNEDYVEIKSGLTEGQVIILPQLAASNTTTEDAATTSGMGGMGGMGGMSGGGQGGPPGGF